MPDYEELWKTLTLTIGLMSSVLHKAGREESAVLCEEIVNLMMDAEAGKLND